MKTLQLLGLLFLISCGNRISEPQIDFRHILPDTSKSWAGQMTHEAFHQTRKLEEKLNVRSLISGVKGEEMRIWGLSGSYDPQRLTILSKADGEGWNIRQVSFYHTKNDSISSDDAKPIENFLFDDYWNLASQSDLKNSDDYGCLDGGDVFIEMANVAKYRFMWYRCPDINEKKDSAFYQVTELRRKIAGLIEERQSR
jgi:hypothetical protein